ncbi:MAG: OmpA family protein [Tunicatimonas sp.]
MRWIAVLLLLGLSGQALAQFAPPKSSSLEEADKYYQTQQYAPAALLYQSAVARDTTDWQSTYRLAESLRHLFRYQEARGQYRRVYQNASRSFPDAELRYAQLLQRAGRCPEALPLLTNFVAAQPDHPLADEARAAQQGCYQSALTATERSSVTLQRLPPPFNTKAHDYAAVPYRSDTSLVLTSGRWDASLRRPDPRYGENHTNLVWIENRGKGSRDYSRAIKPWNSDAHDGPGCFDALGQAFYFTHCQADYCRLYVSRLQAGRWQAPMPLSASVNAPASNSKHPALSPGGDTLFFASDRPGGAGGFDLWLSVRDSAGDWQSARPLEDINTSEDEIAPFYHGAEDLFCFASSGRSGPGGMDLYGVPRWSSGQPGPQLLLSPINSVHDDCFLAIGKSQGYVSSNRAGNFDVYRFTYDTTRSLTTQLLGNTGRLPQLAAQETARPRTRRNALFGDDIFVPTPPDDIVVVRSVPQERLANGSSRFVLASDVNELALSRLRGRAGEEVGKPAAERTQAPDDRTGSLVTISTDSITRDQRGELRGTLLQGREGELETLPQAQVHLLDSVGAIAKITTTNQDGRFHFVNLNPASRYMLVTGDPTSAGEGALQVQNIRLTSYREVNTTRSYEALYFEFNASSLRLESRQSLRELVQFLERNPEAVAEINAFADTLGNDAYNLRLSRQRATTVFDFLVAQGVNPSALVLNAEGSSTAWSSTNALVSQQLNRRVEIRLIGQDLRYTPSAEIRILRPDVSLQNLSRTLGVSLSELEQLNGRSVDTLVSYQPLRVPRMRSPALKRFFFGINQQN